MDVNGLRFWMLSSRDDWALTKAADAVASGAYFCGDRNRLQLRGTPSAPPAPEHFVIASQRLDVAPYARDPFGTYARWDAGSGHVMAGGAGPDEVPIYAPPPLAPVTDLALGTDGVLYVAVGGALVFVDRRDRWPVFTLPDAGVKFWRLAVHPEGGVVGLDREGRQLARVQGLPLGDPPPRPVAPGVLRPCDDNPDPPRVSAKTPLADGELYVGLTVSDGGTFALLSWHTNDAANDQVYLRIFPALDELGARQRLAGVTFPYALAFIDETHIALLATSNKQAWIYELDPLADVLAPSGDSYVLADVDVGPFAHGSGSPPYYEHDGELVPLVPLSLSSWSDRGSADGARRFDSGAARTAWHRLYIEAVLPARCGAIVWLAAADRRADLDAADLTWYPHAFGDVEMPDGFQDVPRAGWQRSASEVPFHPGLLGDAPQPDRRGLFTVLVQRADRAVRTLRGRYLAVKIDLVGSRRSTPEIAALRVYGARFSYVDNYLPELYREDTFGPDAEAPGESTAADFFERFVDIFEAQMTDIEGRVASSYLLTVPDSTPDAALDWVGGWVGVVPEVEPPARRRARIKASPELYQRRGTLAAIARAIDLATDGLCERGAIVLLEDYRLRHTFATILGANLAIKDDPLLPGYFPSANSFVGETLFLGDEHRKEFLSLFADVLTSASERAAIAELFDDLANRLTVFVHDAVEPVDRQLVLRVVEREKPAHVAVSYKRASQPFLVGLASLLGTNTYLAPAPPRQLARVDESHLGRWAFISDLPVLDPRYENSREALRLEKPIAKVSGPRVVLAGQSITLDGRGSLPPPGTTITDFHWTVLPPKPD